MISCDFRSPVSCGSGGSGSGSCGSGGSGAGHVHAEEIKLCNT